MRIPACKPLVRAVALLAIAWLAGACSKQPANFVARVGDEVITGETFRAEAVRRGVSGDEAKNALLEQMVSDLKLLQHARQKGYEKDPKVVREYRAMLIGRAKSDFGVGAEAAVGTIADAELQAYYAAHQPEFAVPARVHAAMIFIATPPSLNAGALAEKRQKAEDARAAIVAAAAPPEAHFAALAVTFSEDQATRYVGGDLGYQVEGLASFSEDPVARGALFALKDPGQLSEVVAGRSGLYLFKLIERNPPSVQPLAMVRDRIRSKLQAAQRQEKEQVFNAALTAIPADIRTNMLAHIDLPKPHLAENKRTAPPPVPGATAQAP